MRTALTENSEIILQEIGTQKTFRFKILETVGMGASCIVYTAVYEDAEKNQIFVRLKECYPAELEISRNQKQELVISDTEIFRKELQHFTDGYQNQLKFRTIPESMNSISNIQGIYQGNDTKYIAMSCQNGISLKQADLNIYDIFRVLKSVTRQIQNFHENGWLYLDLKPENILLYPETPELVMLFDFDSALKLNEIQSGRLSFTKSWSAPEVMQKKLSKISICSDIYSIGALLMYLLLGRTPEVSDRRSFTSWDSEFENSLLAKENPETKKLVSDIFRNTLSSDVNSRYASCQDLLDVIEPFIQSFQKQKPYLKTVLPMGTNYFCGREREISEIHEILQNQTNFLILHGIGGIGKSELAKNYAKAFSEAYDAVVFVRYHDSISETIADDLQFHVEHLQRSEEESDEEYFNRKIKVLKSICTPRHLIILDNFDTDECEYLDELTSLPCKFLITSRTDFSEVFSQYEIDILDDFTSIFSIFQHYYHHDTESFTEEIENIIYALEWHTMAVELVSKQMNLNHITPAEMYEKLCEQGISASKEKIKHLKDGTLRNRNALNHIEVLFSVFDLSENLKQILKHIALIGSVQIDRIYFLCICGFGEQEIACLNTAVQGGWIQLYEKDFYIHPLIAEALCSQIDTTTESCEKLILNLTEVAEHIDYFQADYRFLHEIILYHVGEHLSGDNQLTADFYFALSLVYQKMYDYENAEKCLLRVVKWNEIRNIGVTGFEHINLAYLAEAQGKKKQAELYAETVPEYLSESSEFLLSEALRNFKSGNFQELKQNILKLKECDCLPSELIFGYYLLVNLAMKQENDDYTQYALEGLQYVEDVLEEFQDDSDLELQSRTYAFITELYLAAGKYENCISFSERFFALEPEVFNIDSNVKVCLTLCIAYLALQNTEKATKYFEEGIYKIENHYGIFHPKRLEYYRMYQKTWADLWLGNDDIYYFSRCEILMEKILSFLENMEEWEQLAEAEIEYSSLICYIDDEVRCLQHLEKGLQYYKNSYDKDSVKLIIPLCTASENLKYFQHPEYKDYLEEILRLCIINDLTELREYIEEILVEES